MTPAARRSIARDQDEHGDRNDAGQHDLWEVAREHRLQRVDAGDGRGRDLRALRAVERRRLPSQPSPRRASSRSSETRPRRHAGRRPRSPTRRAPAPRRQRRGATSGVVTSVERGAIERARCDASEQDRLREDEQRRDDAERSVRDERHAYRPRAAQEAPIERVASRAVLYRRVGYGARLGRRPRARARPRSDSAPRRWRKTWYVQPW